MKSMLYVGATLMIGASIYGFVDYKQTHNKKEFKEMYSEKKTVAPPAVTVAEETVTVTEKKDVVKTKPASSRKKKVVTTNEDIVAVQPVSEDEKMTTETISLKEEPVTVTPAKESGVVKAVKKKRKISSKLFSRAPLREEVELTEVAPKKEVKKTESKQL